MSGFVHLHVHTQYSILDGASNISALIAKAKNDGMPAVAITDHGNMFGVKEFVNEANKQGIKPVIGCEVYVATRSRTDRTDKEDRSSRHLILLAKNLTGYHNLAKLVSLGYVEGFYYKPRIDKELLRQYHDGLIASSACLGGEVPELFFTEGETAAENAILEYADIFGKDFYLELQRHFTGDPQTDSEVFDRQQKVNEFLARMAKKHGIGLIATNDVHFVNAEDAEAHDRLICLNTNAEIDDPDRLRYTKQEYFKITAEMAELFADFPEALENTVSIAEQVESYSLERDPVMPHFPLPDGFTDDNEYLRHLTYEGAARRYGEMDETIRARIDYELGVIKKMGYPGYFLIVWDFLRAAREMGVAVGPGRGSAAGSVVAYCLRITDIDPLKYGLLFERFLNPERISMPDIDVD
ncbi:MAG TPA: DNA polymerase III subunit alpha, partial [Bacteroidales bacterium]|nr:DNA polymerase III subunit alpha [Bacteroidales bacterium]